MVTMLDCIKRTPQTGAVILDKALFNTEVLTKVINDFKDIREIVLIGSGSSFNASVSELDFIEKVTRIQTHAYLPNDFAKKTIYDEKGIYVFVSQSGTSTLVKEQIIKINELGYPTIAVTDDETSPIATTARVHVPLEVGNEEFGYRTVGFSATLLTLKVIALRISLEKGVIDNAQFKEFITDGRKALEHHNAVAEDCLNWFEANKEILKPLRSIMYYGGGTLHGIAIEGALKLMETPKIYLAAGFEAEDGIHGPCYAFRKGDAIIFLDDGGKDKWYAESMVRFSKNELGVGYMFGPEPVDDKDLVIKPVSEFFREIEYAPSVQVIAYEMAIINNIEVLEMSKRIPHVSTKYIQTHRG